MFIRGIPFQTFIQPAESVVYFIYYSLWSGEVDFLTQMRMWSLFYTDIYTSILKKKTCHTGPENKTA